MVLLVSVLPTVIVLLIVAEVVAGAIFSLVSDKKKGKSTCGGNCAHCAMAGSCHGGSGTAPKKKSS